MSLQLDQLTKSLVELYTEKLNAQEQQELVQCLEILANDQKYNKFRNYFMDTGDFRRELYPKHVSFFKGGRDYQERGFIAGNRVGKTEAGNYETVCHATGLYQDWWKEEDGFLRFKRPTTIWIGGDTGTTVRDIIQKKLMGDITDHGSGMMPKDCIIDYKTRRNVPDALEIVRIRHITGGVSTIHFKTYEQGRISWQGTEVDFIWMDEECPQEIYGEALIRLMTTNGRIITTFTPLQGLTELVLNLLENSQETESLSPKHITVCGWDDVPHLSEKMKADMLASTPPQLREARSKGVPTVGSGLIYPVDMKIAVMDDIRLPNHYKKLYGFDVGWNNTAAVWGALDMDNDIIYIYSEYKLGQEKPPVHAAAIKARGNWMKGTIDPAARGRSQIDGEKLFLMYRAEGLKIFPANNAREAGIFEVWNRLTTGRLRIFKSCSMLLREFSLYHRDEKGQIVKTNDHLLDALRYLCMADKTMWSYPVDERKTINTTAVVTAMNACV
jgi:phage terminase large subunit-like protein